MDIIWYIGLVRHCVLFAVLVICAYSDLANGKVYNWCTYSGIVLGILLQTASGGIVGDGPNLLNSIVGLGIGGGIFGVAFLFKGVGGGDVKLMAAVGALGGIRFVLCAILYSALAGMLICTGVLIWYGWSKGRRQTVPYGFAIAVGTMVAWFLLDGRM